MPKQPDPDCLYCGGTGVMKPEYLSLIGAQDHPACICTVTQHEFLEKPDQIVRDVRGLSRD